MFFRRKLQKLVVNAFSGTPEPYYLSMIDNVYSQIMMRDVTDAFTVLSYEKRLNITHVLVFCSALTLASYRYYNRGTDDTERSKKILHALNYYNFNKVYPLVVDGFGFKSLKDATNFLTFRAEEYCSAIDDNSYNACALMFLEQALQDECDAFDTGMRELFSIQIEYSMRHGAYFFTHGKFDHTANHPEDTATDLGIMT
jgi:hypothetical protein